MASKTPGIFLLPVACGVFLMSSARRQHEKHGSVSLRRVLRDSIVHGAVLVFLVLPLWWAGHLFARATPQELALYQDVPSSAPWLSPHRLPDLAMTLAPIIGLRHQIEHSANGGDAFLMGERSGSGWWYFFRSRSSSRAHRPNLHLPRSWRWPQPLPSRQPSRSWAQLDSSLRCLLLAAFVLSAALVTSNLNLGHRYMIPLYPILIIAACDRLCLRLQDRRGWLVVSVTALDRVAGLQQHGNRAALPRLSEPVLRGPRERLAAAGRLEPRLGPGSSGASRLSRRAPSRPRSDEVTSGPRSRRRMA